MAWLKEWLFTIILCIWALCVGITSYILIKENTTPIDFKTLISTLQQEQVEQILIDSNHTYFYMTDEKIYKILTTKLYGCLNARIVSKTDRDKMTNIKKTCGLYLSFIDNGLPVIAPKTSLIMKICYAVIVFLIGWVLLYILYEEIEPKIWRKESTNTDTNSYSDDDTTEMSLTLEPMKSSVRFCDVAGLRKQKMIY